MNKTTSFSIWYVLLAIMAVVLVHDFIHALNKVEELPYSQFKSLVAAGKVAEVSVTSQVLTGKLKARRRIQGTESLCDRAGRGSGSRP